MSDPVGRRQRVEAKIQAITTLSRLGRTDILPTGHIEATRAGASQDRLPSVTPRQQPAMPSMTWPRPQANLQPLYERPQANFPPSYGTPQPAATCRECCYCYECDPFRSGYNDSRYRYCYHSLPMSVVHHPSQCNHIAMQQQGRSQTAPHDQRQHLAGPSYGRQTFTEAPVSEEPQDFTAQENHTLPIGGYATINWSIPAGSGDADNYLYTNARPATSSDYYGANTEPDRFPPSSAKCSLCDTQIR
ncbi:hypothetical protein K431DRAFT_292780 [Polychaeton citri CBS 116435]|uniref:Uncharacterized protein n=1 Tax=Polychaeton citri CBS 116435 TaxID=1314669 RepID=A0A9P4QDX1_9PEZI|nr:hypothetical protein K431DRAFT_292780 [Polychaeton citri CBS 116435]